MSQKVKNAEFPIVRSDHVTITTLKYPIYQVIQAQNLRDINVVYYQFLEKPYLKPKDP